MSECTVNQYTLPKIEFIGGGYQKIPFRVFHYIGRRPFDLTGCECYFSLVNYTSQSGPIVMSKKMTIEPADSDGVANIITVELESDETLNMFGKYIYQITIVGSDGTPEAPKQGIMNIIQNIDKTLLQ